MKLKAYLWGEIRISLGLCVDRVEGGRGMRHIMTMTATLLFHNIILCCSIKILAEKKLCKLLKIGIELASHIKVVMILTDTNHDFCFSHSLDASMK